MINKYLPSFTQFVALALLGLSIYLKSPSVACAVVLVLVVKEAREVFDARQRNVDMVTLERKVEEIDTKIKSFQNDVNRVVVRQAQYFGE